MKQLLILTLALPLVAATVPPVPVAPLTPEQKERVECVAALAIAANDQQRGAPGWDGLPWLKDRGAHFAGLTGEAIMKESGRTREEVRTEILGAVAVIQQQTPQRANLQAVAKERVEQCITLMDKLDPPPPRPTMLRCAALTAIAFEDVRVREGNSNTAKQLGLIAGILSSHAHDELRSEGKTEAEGDVALGLEKEKITKAARVRQSKRSPADDDTSEFEYCASLAVPSPKL
jgi:hypothetical protein